MVTTPKRLTLIGCGHAHVQVLESFAQDPPDADVTVVVDTPIAMYSGMVPGFVAGQYEPSELEIDARRLAERAGADLIISAARRINPQDRAVELDDGSTLDYDLASINIGSTVAGRDLPGVCQHALPTRPIDEFVHRIDHVITNPRQDPRGPAPFHIIVVGSGAGGVELAFTIEHRLRSTTTLQPVVTLLDAGSRILNGQPDSVRKRVLRELVRRNIQLRYNARVTEVRGDAVVIEDQPPVNADLVIWVGGPVSHPLFIRSSLPTDERGFVRIRSTLQVEGHDDVFAVGDCATLIDYPETPKAGVYAVRQGPVVTRNLRASLAGHPLETYRPQRDFLALLNTGGGIAIGAKWGISFRGRWVMWLKDRIDRAFMRRFQ